MLNGWAVGLLVAVALAALLAARRAKTLKERAQYREALRDVFAGVGLPRLEAGVSYSYPSIEVSFQTEEDFRHAEEEGLQRAFCARIQTVHKRMREFDAETAVYFTWDDRPPPVPLS